MDFLSRIAAYRRGLLNLYGMLTGTNYWFAPLGLGPHFAPGELSGYAVDFSVKKQWDGLVDEAGIPVCRTGDGGKIVHPMMVTQKALAHWDDWIGCGRRDAESLDTVLLYADWVVANQDERGGWETWTLVKIPTATPYSAMTQGLCISVLMRAHRAAGDEKYLASARRAVDLMRQPVSQGGTSWRVRSGLVLEEAPFERMNPVLNGWIFALFGLHDLTAAVDHEPAKEALDATVEALAAMLGRFDAGFWSYYDLRGRFASPFYHALHARQLEAMSRAFPSHSDLFGRMGARFAEDLNNSARLWRAVALKSVQRLKDPPINGLK